MERILVFIPVYNCEKQIKRVLAQFDISMKNIFSEILIVDNRSSDRTLEACTEAMSQIPYFKTTLIQNAKNYNLGGSHKVAFNYAIKHKYQYVIVLHGDDQGNIKDIIEPIRNGGHRSVDCLLGARFMRGSKRVNYSKLRTAGNIIFNILFSLACQRQLYDLGAGLNMYKISFLRDLFFLRFPNTLTFNYYMILYTAAVGASFSFFPLSWREDDQVSNVKLLRQTQQLFKILYKFSFSHAAFILNPHEKDQKYLYHKIYSLNHKKALT